MWTIATAGLRPGEAAGLTLEQVADSLVAELGRHVSEFPSHEIEPGATLLFTNDKGQPLRRNTMGGSWDGIRKQLDLPPAARGWHSLRHTCASWLIEAGLSVKPSKPDSVTPPPPKPSRCTATSGPTPRTTPAPPSTLDIRKRDE